MGTVKDTDRVQGFIVPDPQIKHETLAAIGAGTTDSAYTQAGPRAGIPTITTDTDLVLEASGSQGADGELEIVCHRAGGPGANEGGFVWRDVAAGDSSSQVKGWDGPQIVTGWEPLLWTTSPQGADLRPDVIRLSSGRLLSTVSSTVLGVVRIERFDPADGLWTAANLTPKNAGSTYVSTAAALLELPSERVLCALVSNDSNQIDVYYTDDEGDTWAAAGFRVLEEALTDSGGTDAIVINDIRWDYSNGQILLMLGYVDPAGDAAAQFASTDLGATFELVLAEWIDPTEEPVSINVLGLMGGGFVVVYVARIPAGVADAFSRTIGSALTQILSFSRVGISTDTGVPDDVVAWRGEGGPEIYALTTKNGTGSIGRPHRSIDGGKSWQGWTQVNEAFSLHSGNTFTNRFERWAAAETAGRTALITRFTSQDSYADKSVAVIWMGGYSSHTAPLVNGSVNLRDRDLDFVGWGDGLSRLGGLYLPADVPDNVDWPVLGLGSSAINTSAQLAISTAAQRRDFSRSLADTGVTAAFFEFAVEIDSGDGDTATDEIAFKISLSGAVLLYSIEVRLSSTGYRLHDSQAGADIGAEVAFDLTTMGRIRGALDIEGNAMLWHARSGHVRSWTQGRTATSLTFGAGGGPSSVSWGHQTGTAESRWEMVGYTYCPSKWHGIQVGPLASEWSNPDYLHARTWTPEPTGVVDGVRIRAKDGPGYNGDLWTIATAYDHPISAIDWRRASSPSRTWRSKGTATAAHLVWDLEAGDFGNSAMRNHSIAVVIMGANFETAVLEGWDGAAWQTIGTATASTGWSSLAYRRRGSRVQVDTGTATQGPLYFWYGFHVGDTFDLGAGEATDRHHRISHNTEGAWDDGSTKRPTITLARDNLPGALANSATGTGAVWRTSFGVIVHDFTDDYSLIRLRIPSQTTADGYFEIGNVLIGHLAAFGHQYDRGFTRITTSNTESFQRRSGSTRVRKLGPAAREVEISWAQTAVDASTAQTKNPSPDYVVGVTGSSNPIASTTDTIRLVEGVILESDGPVSPVVYVARVTTSIGTSQQMIDRREFVYGRIETDPQADHVVGDEGLSEVERLNTIRLREIV